MLGQGSYDTGAVLAGAVDYNPTAVGGAVGSIRASPNGGVIIHINFTGLAHVHLSLELGYCFPVDASLTVAIGAGSASYTNDVWVDPGQFVQVLESQVTG